MRKLLLINLLVFAGLLAVAETAASLLESRQGQPLALVRLAQQLRSRATGEALSTTDCISSPRWIPPSPLQL